MRKKSIALLLALTVLLGLAAPICAAQLPDETRSGSLVIQMKYDGEPLDSGALTLCRVAEIGIYDGNAYFTLVDALTGGPSLDKLDDPALAAQLAELAAENDLPTIRAQIKEGRAEFPQLEPGLYVVTQPKADAAQGFDPIRPFLLSLPQWNGETYV